MLILKNQKLIIVNKSVKNKDKVIMKMYLVKILMNLHKIIHLLNKLKKQHKILNKVNKNRLLLNKPRIVKIKVKKLN